MENKHRLPNSNDSTPEPKCNEMPAPSLEEVERKISMITKHNNNAPSNEFRDQLKARVLEVHAKNNMPRVSFKDFFSSFKVSRVSVSIAAFLVVAVVGGVLLNSFLPGRGGVERIFISPAYAADDFALTPLVDDSAGVTPDASYKLTSKESFTTDSIKAGLKLSPDVKAEVTKVSDKEWIIKPKALLAANSLLRVSLQTQYNDNGKLLPRDFSWTFQVKDNFRVLNTLPGNSKGVPVESGIEITFSHGELGNFEQSFSIEPKVAGKFETHGRTYVFVPTQPLKYGELYTVKLGSELGIAGSDQKLEKDFTFTFETQTKPDGGSGKWFGVNSEMIQVSPEENPHIQVYGETTMPVSVNVYSFATFDSFVTSLTARDVYPRWSEKWNNYRYDTTKLNRVVSFSPKIETQNYSNLIVFPSHLPAGFYLAEVGYEDKIVSVLLEVNDLNIIYNIDAEKMLVWANRPGDGSAVSGASISIGDQLSGIKTNSAGVATFDIPKAYLSTPSAWMNLQNQKPIYMIVRTGESASVTELSFGSEGNPSRWAYFYTDRPRYQSSDTLRFWAMTRDRSNSAVMSGKYSVVLKKSGWFDYYYNPVKIAEVVVTPDAYGTVIGEIPLNGLRPDSYQVVLTLEGKDVATRNITVLPYVKPAYSISVTSDKSAVFAGEQINFTAEAKFFDGTPVSGIKMKVERMDGSVMGTFTADNEGKIIFSDTKAYQQSNPLPGGGVSDYYKVSPVSAELGEISGSASATWYGSRYYTTTNINYPSAGKGQIDFTVRKIDLNKINSAAGNAWADDARGSETVSGTTITGSLYKTYYVKVETGTAYDYINKTSYKTYRYDRKEDKINSISLVTDSAGKARYSLALEKEVSYRLEYLVIDTMGRAEVGNVYAYYFDGSIYYRDFYPDPNNQLTIEFNRSDRTYSLGEKVKATAVSENKPVAASATNRFLFAKYQNGLKEWNTQTSSAYEFSFAQKDIPNVQIFVAWWDGKTYRTARTDGWWGASDGGAKYRYNDRKLSVGAVLDKDVYAPGEQAKLTLTVKDKDGRPVKSAVNINLVDEAYYAIADESVDPLASIYTPLYSGLIASTQTQKAAPLAMESGAERGGCFVAGTLITMADGKTKPIEQIKVGDKVKTLSNPLIVDAVTGTVTAVFEHAGNKLVSINNGLLVATPEHMIYAGDTFKTAGEIKIGDVLIGLDGKKIIVSSTKIIFSQTRVYNFRVDPYHSYIANGVYVHNDKDGAVRQNFVDTALFRTVETDKNGNAVLDFKLPDNVTTWRLTAQAIASDLSAGVGIHKIKSTLPVFLDVAVGSEYLTGDEVVAKLRAYGVKFSGSDSVTYTVTSAGLGSGSYEYKTESKAFVPTEINLPKLSTGKFDVTYSMSSEKGKDAIKLPVSVVESYLRAYKILSTDKVIAGKVFTAAGAKDNVEIVFADSATTRYYQMLSGLSWEWGKRVDQTLAREMAIDLLIQYYKEEGRESQFDGSIYQQADGGIALLPYGSSDLDLTARLTALAAGKFDQSALRQYFLRELERVDATPETVSSALLGLSALKDPVLPRLEAWASRTDLSSASKMRVALAFYSFGATENARAIYNNVLTSAELRGEYYLLSGKDDAETLNQTAFLAELAAALNMPERDRLWAYVEDHDVRKETLVSLEQIAYSAYALPTLAPGPSMVSYELNGAKGEINLNGWGDKSISLNVSDLPKLKILSVTGDASATVSAMMPISSSSATNDQVRITRSYSVDGKVGNEFKDGDIVRVSLNAVINKKSPSNNYLVTDILPAGLTPVSGSVNPYLDKGGYYWINPFSVEGQTVSFNLWKGTEFNKDGYYYAKEIYYYARVKTKGTYKAEPAMIQAFQDPNTINFSDARMVTVK